MNSEHWVQYIPPKTILNVCRSRISSSKNAELFECEKSSQTHQMAITSHFRVCCLLITPYVNHHKSLRSLIEPSDKVIESNPCPVVATMAECFAETLLVEKYIWTWQVFSRVRRCSLIPSDRMTAAFCPPACPREIRCGRKTAPSPSRSSTTLEALMAYQHEIHWGNAELTCSLCSNYFFCFSASRSNCSHCSSKSVFSELTSV